MGMPIPPHSHLRSRARSWPFSPSERVCRNFGKHLSSHSAAPQWCCCQLQAGTARLPVSPDSHSHSHQPFEAMEGVGAARQHTGVLTDVLTSDRQRCGAASAAAHHLLEHSMRRQQPLWASSDPWLTRKPVPTPRQPPPLPCRPTRPLRPLAASSPPRTQMPPPCSGPDAPQAPTCSPRTGNPPI